MKDLRALFQRLALICAALLISACATSGGASASGASPGFSSQRDYFPGGVSEYVFGEAQSKPNFENIEIAQSAYTLHQARRAWLPVQPGNSPSATVIGLYQYYPLHVRWKLKDGREFILENIDIRAIMREYFKTNDIKPQWQREGRPKARVGDGWPMLSYEVKDASVLIKWVITINHTPVNERLTPSGAANPWHLSDEQYVVTTLRGNPTTGIDFKNWLEMKNQ